MVCDVGVVGSEVFREVETGSFDSKEVGISDSEANSVGYKGASVMTCLPISVDADTNEGVLYQAGASDRVAVNSIDGMQESGSLDEAVDAVPSITLPEVPREWAVIIFFETGFLRGIPFRPGSDTVYPTGDDSNSSISISRFVSSVLSPWVAGSATSPARSAWM